MAKIMEIIERKIDFRKQTATLTLLDSNFQSLSKKLGSVPGRTMLNAGPDEYIGYELATDIQNRQLEIYNSLNVWRSEKLNPEIERYKNKGIAVNLFDMTISVPNWAGKYTAESPADFDFLTDILNYENTLRRFTSDVASHCGYVLSIAADWSKERNYGSTVDEIIVNVASDGNLILSDWWFSDNGPLKVSTSKKQPTSVQTFHFTNLQSLEVGQSVTVKCCISWHRAGNYNERICLLTIKRSPLGVDEKDDGFFEFIATNSQGGPSISRFTGVPSTHFITDSPTFNFTKTRVLL